MSSNCPVEREDTAKNSPGELLVPPSSGLTPRPQNLSPGLESEPSLSAIAPASPMRRREDKRSRLDAVELVVKKDTEGVETPAPGVTNREDAIHLRRTWRASARDVSNSLRLDCCSSRSTRRVATSRTLYRLNAFLFAINVFWVVMFIFVPRDVHHLVRITNASLVPAGQAQVLEFQVGLHVTELLMGCTNAVYHAFVVCFCSYHHSQIRRGYSNARWAHTFATLSIFLLATVMTVAPTDVLLLAFILCATCISSSIMSSEERIATSVDVHLPNADDMLAQPRVAMHPSHPHPGLNAYPANDGDTADDEAQGISVDLEIEDGDHPESRSSVPAVVSPNGSFFVEQEVTGIRGINVASAWALFALFTPCIVLLVMGLSSSFPQYHYVMMGVCAALSCAVGLLFTFRRTMSMTSVCTELVYVSLSYVAFFVFAGMLQQSRFFS